MKIPSLFMLLALIILAAGCTSSQKTAGTKTETSTNGKPVGLAMKLSVAGVSNNPKSVNLRFTVYNNADTIQRFCKYGTPFEPLLAKYLEVTNQSGTEATYIGAMARRVMPPPADSYVNVAAHDSVTVTFDLLKGYAIPGAGTYKVTYTGSGLSGLKSDDSIKVVIP